MSMSSGSGWMVSEVGRMDVDVWWSVAADATRVGVGGFVSGSISGRLSGSASGAGVEEAVGKRACCVSL